MQSTSYIKASFPHPFVSELQEFYRIFCAWNRRAELLRLLNWATSKRLDKQRQRYHFLLEQQELRLHRYRIYFPRKATWAHRLYLLAKILNHQEHFPQGSARHYWSRQIDNRKYW